MKKVSANILVQNKKHTYSLSQRSGGVIFFECTDAHISQEFLAEDVPALLIDLPNLILAEKEYTDSQSEVIRFRISPKDKAKIEKNALRKGYSSLSEYLRALALG